MDRVLTAGTELGNQISWGVREAVSHLAPVCLHLRDKGARRTFLPEAGVSAAHEGFRDSDTEYVESTSDST